MIPIVLDRSSTVSLAPQIAAEVRRLVAEGGLPDAAPLPSTRGLAQRLGVSRGTVVAAYDQLASEGYLDTTPGGTTRVAEGAGGRTRAGTLRLRTGQPAAAAPRPSPAAPRPSPAASAPDLLELRPQRRSGAAIDDPAWREGWRRAATSDSPPASPEGLPELRAAIAEHLRLMRAMPVDPERIIVTAGARGGLALLLGGLAHELGPVAVESPGHPGPRRVLDRLGAAVLPAPVDAEGIRVEDVPGAARSILVTPNHLFPAGSIMPAARRTALLDRAAARDALVIEDDLDSDERHLGPVLPSLWDLAPERVAHLGTFSRVLNSDVGIGYLLVPGPLVAPLREAQDDLGSGPPVIAQRALQAFLASGGLRRRLTRRRRALRRRRDELLAGLAEAGPLVLSGARILVPTGDAAEAEALAGACRERGLAVGTLHGYWGAERSPRSGADGKPAPVSSMPDERAASSASAGIVIDAADASPAELARGLMILRGVLGRGR